MPDAVGCGAQGSRIDDVFQDLVLSDVVEECVARADGQVRHRTVGVAHGEAAHCAVNISELRVGIVDRPVAIALRQFGGCSLEEEALDRVVAGLVTPDQSHDVIVEVVRAVDACGRGTGIVHQVTRAASTRDGPPSYRRPLLPDVPTIRYWPVVSEGRMPCQVETG